MAKLRITSGTAKNRQIKSPEIEEFRATQEKAKLAIFSVLGEKIVDAICLDLYAGSGNLGLEALSRGAEFCDFVDESRKASQTIEENLHDLQFTEKAEIHTQDAIKFVGNTFRNYDVIFADPYYKDTHFRFLFENLEKILNEKGVIVFSHGVETDIADALTNTQNLKIHTSKKYGNAFITILQKISE